MGVVVKHDPIASDASVWNSPQRLKLSGRLDTELIPARERPSAGRLIVLHGLGDSIAGCRWIPEALNLSWLDCLLVNAPDTYLGGYSWYDFTGHIIPGVTRSRALITALLDQQISSGISSERIILSGFSQGCLMTLEAGLRYPQRLAGLVGISGYIADVGKLLSERSPHAKRLPVLMTHGVVDPIIPFLVVRDQIKTLQEAGLQIEWHELMKPHIIAGEPELAIIRKFIREQLGKV